jgi:hypothetical protein
MLVTVKRSADGKVDTVSIYPETQEEVTTLSNMIEDRVNLAKGLVFLNKEPGVKIKGTKPLPDYESPDANSEVHRHK